MRQNLTFLVLMLLVVFAGRSNVVTGSEDDESSKKLSPKSPFGSRLVRANDKATSKFEGEERDITTWSVVSAAFKAMRMKAKVNNMAESGLLPVKALKKLKVVRMSDKNFNNFARYYAKYRAKYSAKNPNLPATAEDVILLPKLKEWLDQRLLPSQVKYNLKDLASTNVNKYLQLYLKDADNTIILPKLQHWLDQKLLPSQVIYNLNDYGVTDTTKYVEWYMRNGGEGPVMAKLKKWFHEDVPLARITPKLEKIGVTDTSKYTEWYRDAPVVVQIKEWINARLFPPQVVLKLKEIGVKDPRRYYRIISDTYGKRQMEKERQMLRLNEDI